MRIELDGKTVFVSTGTGRHRPGARAITFVHGAGMDHSVWVMPARYFARHGFNVVAVDLPGHGRSDGPAMVSIGAMSDWLARVLAALAIERTTVVGHSMGSLVAHALAGRHPDLVGAVALLGTAMPMPVTELLLRAARDDDHAAIDMANAWSHSVQGKLGANRNPGVWMLGAGERLLERAGSGVFYADLSACDDFEPAAQATACPTLFIIGDADQMTPAKAGLAAAQDLANASIVRLPGCGHAMLSERPNEVLDALIAFVD